jgi:hypothetical protein
MLRRLVAGLAVAAMAAPECETSDTALFAFLRGLSMMENYESFFKSCQCVLEATTGCLHLRFDHIVFHDGSVTEGVQLTLRQEM